MVVAYDGAAFRGAAANAGVRTVVGDLTAAIERVVRTPVTLQLSGRTDAGVHAWGQVISTDLSADIDLGDLQRRLNKLCGPTIAVRALDPVEPGFDARFSATSRSYRYHVWNDPVPHPFAAATSWHVPRPLDLAAMQRAASHLVGEHDFSSFCRRPQPCRNTSGSFRHGLCADSGQPPSMVRIMYEVGWRGVTADPMLRFEVRGSAFCHQQVRSMVGTTVDVGLGRVSADDLPQILAARDRHAAGQVAPPHGLMLWEVGYDGSRWDAARQPGS